MSRAKAVLAQGTVCGKEYHIHRTKTKCSLIQQPCNNPIFIKWL